MSKRVRKPNYKCYICGKPFYCPPSRYTGRNACSRKCQGIAYRQNFTAENNPLWKGGTKASRDRQKEDNKNRTRQWYQENKQYAQEYHKKYYRNNIDKFLKKFKAYNKANPSVNKEAVQKWRKNNPGRDPRKYRVGGKLRKKTLELWGNTCPICGREFKQEGHLRPIVHHLQYSPKEWVVVLCYQCHNLIHGRKAYRHPLVAYAGDMAPHIMAQSILSLYERFVSLQRLNPRKQGGSRKNESQATLVKNTKQKAQQLADKVKMG